MKKLIIILAIVACAGMAQADTYCNEAEALIFKETGKREFVKSDNPCWAKEFQRMKERIPPVPMGGAGYPNIYPPDYFTIKTFDPPVYREPVPVYTMPVLRDYPARPYVEYFEYK